MRGDCGCQIVCARVMEIQEPFGQSPKRRGAPLTPSGLPEGDTIGEPGSHVVQEKVRIGKDGLAAEGSNRRAEAAREIGGELHIGIRLVAYGMALGTANIHKRRESRLRL